MISSGQHNGYLGSKLRLRGVWVWDCNPFSLYTSFHVFHLNVTNCLYLNVRFTSRKDTIPTDSQYLLRGDGKEQLLAEAERELKNVAVGLWQRLVAAHIPLYLEYCSCIYHHT